MNLCSSTHSTFRAKLSKDGGMAVLDQTMCPSNSVSSLQEWLKPAASDEGVRNPAVMG